MNITCTVNQTEAIRRGFNASSTVKLDVDVATLTPAQRGALASRFDDGFFSRRTIPQPDLSGFMETLDMIVSEDAAEAVKTAQRKAEFDAAWAEFSTKFDADPRSCIDLSDRCNYCSTHLTGKPYTGTDGTELLTPTQREIYDRISAKLVAEWKAKREATLAANKAREEKAQAEKEAKVARLKAQLDAFVASVGGTLAERHADGFTADKEIMNLIGESERAHLGVSYTGGSDDWSRDDSDAYDGPLTDEQFLALKAWKSKLPEDAKVTIYDLHDHEANEYGDKNEDTKVNRILVAEAEFVVGEIRIKADEQIGTLPDITTEA